MARGQAARWAGQRQRRREEFVDAAIAAIARHGPDASVAQIAAEAGVARTRVYRHFDDRADLERAVGARVAGMVVGELAPLWHPRGSARAMFTAAIGAHVDWLAGHRNLYRYLLTRTRGASTDGPLDGSPAVRRAAGAHLSAFLAGYFELVGAEVEVSEPLAFGILGLVESATERWLQAPGALTSAALTDRLADWVWAMTDRTLRAAGVVVDPDLPLPPLPCPPPAPQPPAPQPPARNR